jgi:hypothetical protein
MGSLYVRYVPNDMFQREWAYIFSYICICGIMVPTHQHLDASEDVRGVL